LCEEKEPKGECPVISLDCCVLVAQVCKNAAHP
jgi:hypothetical protein